MTQPNRILRSTIVGHRPPAGTLDGSAWVNYPEMQFGVVDAQGNNNPLLGVPMWSQLNTYQPGNPVNYQGQLYVCIVATIAGPWVAAQWQLVLHGDAPSDGNAYMRSNAGWSSGGTLTGSVAFTGSPPAAFTGSPTVNGKAIVDPTFDTSWHPFAYQNGWVDYAAPYSPAGYRKISSGLVILRGLIMNGTASPMFTLPAGYRPGIQMLFGVETSPNALCRVDVAVAGTVSNTGGSSGWISMAGISFLAEN